jgi:hypothetical protein
VNCGTSPSRLSPNHLPLTSCLKLRITHLVLAAAADACRSSTSRSACSGRSTA